MTVEEAARLRAEFAALCAITDRWFVQQWRITRAIGVVSLVIGAGCFEALTLAGHTTGWACAMYLSGVGLGCMVSHASFLGLREQQTRFVDHFGRSALDEHIKRSMGEGGRDG